MRESVRLGGLAILLAAAFGTTAGAQPLGADLRAAPVVLPNCRVLPLDDVRVPVEVSGILSEIKVEEGDRVQQGDVLAVVDDRLARMELERATIDYKNESPIEDARARRDESAASLEESERLWERGIESDSKYRLAQAQLKVAEIAIVNAQEEKRLKGMDLEIAQEKVKRHEIVSPFDGVIVQKVKHRSESVDQLEPIFRIIKTDVVRIEGEVPLRFADRVRAGMKIDVYQQTVTGEVLTLLGHTAGVQAVKVLPGDERCASAGNDGSILLWDLATGLQQQELLGHRGAVYGLASSQAAPNLLVSGGEDGVLRVWDTQTGDLSREIEARAGEIRAIALSPADPNLCVTGHTRSIHVWNLAQGREVSLPSGAFSGHTNWVTSLAFTPDGTRILSAGADNTLRFWDTATGKPAVAPLRGRSEEVQQVGLSHDGSQFLFNSGSFLQVRTLSDGRATEVFTNPGGSFTGVAVFAPQRDLVLAAMDEKRLHLLQPGGNELHQRVVRTYEGHQLPVTAVDFASNGRFFVSGSADRTVRAWLVPNDEQIADERKQGVVKAVGAEANASNQTRRVVAEIPNDDGILNPGTFATVVVYPRLEEVAQSR